MEVSQALLDPHEDSTVTAAASASASAVGGGRRPSARRLRRSLSIVSASGCGSGYYGLRTRARPVTAAQRFDYFVSKVCSVGGNAHVLALVHMI